MGIDVPALALLSAAKHLEVDFSSTAMIGRQNFCGPELELGLDRFFKTQGIQQDGADFRSRNFYCETLFELLGATTIESFDASDYEQATHVHDMNQPVPPEFHERYSFVFDGGTIEHVFNVGQALRNCMEMVRVGGIFAQVNEANNFMGHGFWQFSPEMLFRALSPENGFEVVRVLLHENVFEGAWHAVLDPEQARCRVELCNSHPTYILTLARRVAVKEIFRTVPQQSDYVDQWNRQTPNTLSEKRSAPTYSLPRRLIHGVPSLHRFLRRAKAVAERILPKDPYHRHYYKRLTDEQVWRGEF